MVPTRRTLRSRIWSIRLCCAWSECRGVRFRIRSPHGNWRWNDQIMPFPGHDIMTALRAPLLGKAIKKGGIVVSPYRNACWFFKVKLGQLIITKTRTHIPSCMWRAGAWQLTKQNAAPESSLSHRAAWMTRPGGSASDWLQCLLVSFTQTSLFPPRLSGTSCVACIAGLALLD